MCVCPTGLISTEIRGQLAGGDLLIHHVDLEMELWSSGVAARLPSHLTSPYLFFDDFIHIYDIT